MSNPSDTPLAVKAEMTSPEMAAYYNNRPLMWRNLWLILLLNLGWGTVFSIVSPYRLLPIFCGLLGLHLFLVFQIHSTFMLMVVACLPGVLAPMYGASDIMVYRTADPKISGSLTSTNSCLRGLFIGGISMGSGYLIQHTGQNYYAAFVVAFALQLLGLVALFIYRYMMNRNVSSDIARGTVRMT